MTHHMATPLISRWAGLTLPSSDHTPVAREAAHLVSTVLVEVGHIQRAA